MKVSDGGILVLLIVCAFAIFQGTVLDRTKLALKAGNPKGLSSMFAPTVQFGFDGEAENYSSREAEMQLEKFFKSNPPQNLEPLFQGVGKDGKHYFIGKLVSKAGAYRVSVYWKDGTEMAIQSVDFSKE